MTLSRLTADASAKGTVAFRVASLQSVPVLVHDEKVNVYDIEVSNANTSEVYLQMYDTNQAPTVGVTEPERSYKVPPASGSDRGAMDKMFVVPIGFLEGLYIAMTSSPTGGTVTGDCTVNLGTS